MVFRGQNCPRTPNGLGGRGFGRSG